MDRVCIPSAVFESESELESEPEQEVKIAKNPLRGGPSSTSTLAVEKKYPLSWIQKLDSPSILPFVEKYEIEERGVRRVASDLVLWCESKEKTFKNYRAALEKWISKDYKLRSEVRSNKL